MGIFEYDAEDFVRRALQCRNWIDEEEFVRRAPMSQWDYGDDETPKRQTFYLNIIKMILKILYGTHSNVAMGLGWRAAKHCIRK